MKVVITNAVALNGGDAAILLGAMKLLRAALGGATEFVVFDSQPGPAARRYPEITFHELWHARATRRAGRRLRKIRRAAHLARYRFAAWCRGRAPWLARLLLDGDEQHALADYAGADLIVSTGGTYLVENYSLRPRFFEFRLARTLGRPLVLFTQSLGPFQEPENRRALAGLLRDAVIFVRDAASRRHLLDVSVPDENIFAAADAAFALEAEVPPPRPADGRLRVAISVREWSKFRGLTGDVGMENFSRAMAALAGHLVTVRDAEVTFLSTCQGVPEYRYDDARVAATIVAALPETVRGRVRVDAEFHRPEELIRRLQKFDLVVATRMHMAILSLVAGTPVLPIAYEFKTTELFTRLGLGGWVQEIEKVSPAALTDACDALLADLPAVRAQSRAAAAAERARATAAAEQLKQILEDR